MTKVSSLISKYQNIIKSSNKDESVVFTFIEVLTGLYKSELFLQDAIDIDEEKLSSYVSRYCDGESVQYIINKSYFLGRDFYVDENVLIPRFETEEVVLKAIEVIKENDIKSVYEVGSGSGVIAITIQLETGVNVSSVDISKSALTVAKKNNDDLGSSVKFFLGNVLDEIKDEFEMIVSNPPYIPITGYVAEETLNNEPHIALYGGSDGLDFYREIIQKAKELQKLKFIVFEIGFDQGTSIQLLHENVEIIKDINGNDRIAVIDMRR